jgi:DNA-binding response OmpR family regulator
MSARRHSILLVDDDLLLCRSVERCLRQRGFNIHTVHTAVEAMRSAATMEHDVILLDWVLPDRDGVTLLREFRAAEISVPILMLTGQQAVADKVRVLDMGADDYLVKPVAGDELAARIVAHVRRSTRFSVLRVGRIVLDAWKQEARVDDNRIDLTPLEFAVLSFLARHAERAVSREQIFENAWKDNSDGRARAVDIQVTRLRRKLDDASEQIETVRGVGFRLTAFPRSQ